MKLAGKDARYDVTLLSYRNLKKLVRKFDVLDYTIDVIRRPERYADTGRGSIRRWVARWPLVALHGVLPVIPVHVWMLVKPESPGDVGFRHRHHDDDTPNDEQRLMRGGSGI
jgi:hypothetical protein